MRKPYNMSIDSDVMDRLAEGAPEVNRSRLVEKLLVRWLAERDLSTSGGNGDGIKGRTSGPTPPDESPAAASLTGAAGQAGSGTGRGRPERTSKPDPPNETPLPKIAAWRNR